MIIVAGISLIQLGIKMWSAYVHMYMRNLFLHSDTTIVNIDIYIIIILTMDNKLATLVVGWWNSRCHVTFS